MTRPFVATGMLLGCLALSCGKGLAGIPGMQHPPERYSLGSYYQDRDRLSSARAARARDCEAQQGRARRSHGVGSPCGVPQVAVPDVIYAAWSAAFIRAR